MCERANLEFGREEELPVFLTVQSSFIIWGDALELGGAC